MASYHDTSPTKSYRASRRRQNQPEAHNLDPHPAHNLDPHPAHNLDPHPAHNLDPHPAHNLDPHPAHNLDPNAASFMPQSYPAAGMDYHDLMYYNCAYNQPDYGQYAYSYPVHDQVHYGYSQGRDQGHYYDSVDGHQQSVNGTFPSATGMKRGGSARGRVRNQRSSRPDRNSDRGQYDTNRPDRNSERGQYDTNRPDRNSDRGQYDTNRPDRNSERGLYDTNHPDRNSERGQYDTNRPDRNSERGHDTNRPDRNSERGHDTNTKDTRADRSQRDSRRPTESSKTNEVHPSEKSSRNRERYDREARDGPRERRGGPRFGGSDEQSAHYRTEYDGSSRAGGRNRGRGRSARGEDVRPQNRPGSRASDNKRPNGRVSDNSDRPAGQGGDNNRLAGRFGDNNNRQPSGRGGDYNNRPHGRGADKTERLVDCGGDDGSNHRLTGRDAKENRLPDRDGKNNRLGQGAKGDAYDSRASNSRAEKSSKSKSGADKSETFEARESDGSSHNEDVLKKMPKKFQDFDFRRSKVGGEELESQRGRLIEDLMNSTYECMVCCDVIRRDVAVWSCGECYHVFHLYCIKKWGRSPSALVEGTESGWRCPGCQNVTLKVPNQYLCFCLKQRDPQFSPYETPHSCGEVCGKQRAGHCTHACNILCHPGPCPPCNASVTKACHCAKTSRTVKCSRASEVRCEQTCGNTLNCNQHQCQQVCHKGNCSSCDEQIDQYCYCGKGFRKATCGTEESFLSSYVCGEICGKKLSCGNHECEKVCHDGECEDCELAPDRLRLCACGQTELSDIGGVVRESCRDPVPVCGKVCGKERVCGPEAERHRCSRVCHQGSCGVCEDGVTPVSCRCEATVTEMACSEAAQYLQDCSGSEWLCTRRCNKKRQCGRHKCQQVCCTDTDHACTQACGRKLTCGLHRCEEPCHRGTCDTCWNVCFEEVTCHCGASILDPPVPCGTKPPACAQICQRRHDCEHPVRHACHSDDKCPPCTVLTKKMCMGQHELRHNLPCHITDISCGLPCGKALPCKQHRCTKTCHKGECQNDDEVCEQPCRKPRSWCDHICGVPCHPGVACPETQCESLLEVTCLCGNRSERVMCGAGKKDSQGKPYQQMTSSSMLGKLIYFGNGQTVDINSLNSGKRHLDCNEECAKLERNRRLALALQIENPDLSDKLGAPNYNQFLKDFARANPAFVAEIEKALAELVQNAKTSKFPNRSHSFKPMKREQRRLIHEIAEFYGCKTQSYDYEPVKSVVATAHKGKCWMPNMTLTAAIKRETGAPLPIPHHSTEKDIRAKSAACRQSTTALHTSEDTSKTKDVSRPKFIDYFDFDD